MALATAQIALNATTATKINTVGGTVLILVAVVALSAI